MRIEDFQAFQKQAQTPRDGSQFAGDGRREGDAMKFITAIGEEAFDLCRADAARLRVGGVEPEIVPPF